MVTSFGLKRLSSADHPIVKLALALRGAHGRKKHGLVLLEGLRAAEAAAQSGVKVKAAIVTPAAISGRRAQFIVGLLQKKGTRFYEAPTRLFGRISDVESPQGLVLICSPGLQDSSEALSGDFIVIADRLQDPGNLGTILRCARAFGADAVVTTEGTVEVANPKTLRAAAGAWPGLMVAEGIAHNLLVKELADRKFVLLVSDREGETDYREIQWRDRIALAVGSEAHGISDQLRAAQAHAVRIPHLGGVESLNVGTATAILLAEAFHQRAKGRQLTVE